MYYVKLIFLFTKDVKEEDVEDDDGEEEKKVHVIARFSSEDQYRNISDAGYDMVLRPAEERVTVDGYCHSLIEQVEIPSPNELAALEESDVWDLTHLDVFGWPVKERSS